MPTLMLALTAWLVGTGHAAEAAAPQDDVPEAADDDPSTDDAEPGGAEPGDDTEAGSRADDEPELSNTTTMLIGAVLLSGGIWALRNRQRRFPGAQRREHR